MKERVPDRGLVEPPLDLFARLAPLRVALERRPALLAHHELDLAELVRLEATAGLQPVAEGEKVERGDRLEHVDLRDQRFQNRQNAFEVAPASGVLFERNSCWRTSSACSTSLNDSS